MTFTTIDDIRSANERIGHHFFDRATLRFFSSRILDDVFPAADGSGSYFATSERGPGMPRRYTVRLARSDGSVVTAGEFQAYGSARAAKVAARHLASGSE
jgi:hypothetical protein